MAKPTRTGEARTEPRFALNVPLRVLGVDERNSVFTEETTSQNVSQRGLCFIIKRRITPGTAVSIRLLSGSVWSASAVFQIRWRDSFRSDAKHGALLTDDGEWLAFLNKFGLLESPIS